LDEYTSPHLVVHSKLRRARETAEVAAENVNKKSSLKVYGEIPCLAEVDFGSLDGTEVKDFRKIIRQVSVSWSLGDIDKTAGDGGESGREVLSRAGQAIEELSTLATKTASSSIVAVSHSAYLRILLSLVADSSLAETFLWSIQNGGVNVVDINVEGKRRVVTSESGSLFGGRLLSRFRQNNRLKLDIPECHLIRKNEARHLEGMNI
jgi:broad specificity phosphatase PhoE